MTPDMKFISLNHVCNITSLSRTAINKWRAKGSFPEAIDLGTRRVAFMRDEVRDWMQARVQARDEKRRGV